MCMLIHRRYLDTFILKHACMVNLYDTYYLYSDPLRTLLVLLNMAVELSYKGVYIHRNEADGCSCLYDVALWGGPVLPEVLLHSCLLLTCKGLFAIVDFWLLVVPCMRSPTANSRCFAVLAPQLGT